MEIDQHIAETIVSNIKDVLRHEINLFDTHGVIIASTNRSRIGHHHAAALLAAQTQRTVYVDDDHRYEGARNGINTPVIIEGEVAAVIGVTGERDAVESFGNVIRRMTEIFLRENIEQTARSNRRISETTLINQLIGEHPDTELIRYLASVLDWDVHAPHYVAVGHMAPCSPSLASTPDPVILPVRHLQRLPGSIFTANANGCCLVVESTPDSTAALRDLHEALSTDGVAIGFGVSEPTADLRLIPDRYRQARMALDWQQFTRTVQIVHVSDLDFGLLVPSMDHAYMVQFVDHVFGEIDDARIRAHQRTFDAYTRFNGSITHAAEALHIHKNTMQNHLNGIADDTGYNPRTLQDYSVLDTAFRLYDYLRFTHAYDKAPEA